MFEDKSQQKTTLDSLGEFGLISHLTDQFKIISDHTKVGIGDDAAVLNFNADDVVISTDLLLEGVHFDLAYMPLKHLGFKAVAVNVSDICAMNAKATQITVSIAVSNRFGVEALEELYAGIKIACDKYQVDLVGGDTTSSQKGLIISVTAIGHAKKEDLVYRSGAKPNDLIVVTGDLGGAYMGLQVLEREKQVFLVNPQSQPDLSAYAYIIERQLKPEARIDIKDLLEKLDVKPTAMIDISDGLSSEIIHICKASKVGCQIFEEKIPMDPELIATCEEFNINSATVTLNGGEDYELLFTISLDDFEKIKANPNFTVIGHIQEEAKGVNLISRLNQAIPIKARGFNHLQ
jgi:thiamine-monophosphate kinase